MSHPSTAAQRLLGVSCLGLLVSIAINVPLARETAGRFSGGPILLRPWMLDYNHVVLGVHLLLLVMALFGARVVAGRSFHRPVQALLLLASAATVAFLLFPHVFGAGPFVADGTEIALLRTLVFLPPTVRALAFGMLGLALVSRDGADQGRWLTACFIALTLTDVGLCLWCSVTTPKAVFALIHPCAEHPWLLVPALTIATLTLWRLRTHAGTFLRS